jgi:hypothetical protein
LAALSQPHDKQQPSEASNWREGIGGHAEQQQQYVTRSSQTITCLKQKQDR